MMFVQGSRSEKSSVIDAIKARIKLFSRGKEEKKFRPDNKQKRSFPPLCEA
jgi:hypothetical protein